MLLMTTPIAFLLSILFVAIVLMVTERLRADVVALLVTIALTLTGLIQTTDTFSGFSPEERLLLRRFLQRILQNLTNVSGENQ